VPTHSEIRLGITLSPPCHPYAVWQWRQDEKGQWPVASRGERVATGGDSRVTGSC